MEIYLAEPRGFCAGVDRAIQIVEKALEKFGNPLYVRHEIVHNKSVVNSLKAKGAIFVENLDDVPEGSNVIFSAHGVANAVYQKAEDKNLKIIDAACPLVKKVHFSALKNSKKGSKIILIGHKGHPEVEGTLGQLPEGEMILVSDIQDVNNLKLDDMNLAYITQTTLSVDETKDIIEALKHKYPHINGPEKGDLCYATTNRQNAVKHISSMVNKLLVVGSHNSSNSNRLKELGKQNDVESQLINDESEIDLSWLNPDDKVGISSGASAPEYLVQQVIDFLKDHFPVEKVERVSIMEERTSFPLPSVLKD